jgi:uncharacterized protein (UPF0548 family)
VVQAEQAVVVMVAHMIWVLKVQMLQQTLVVVVVVLLVTIQTQQEEMVVLESL